MGRPVKMGLERDSLFSDLSQFVEAENLIASAVGKDRVGPVHEFMQSAQRADQVVPRPEIEVVGITKDNLCPKGLQVFRGQCFYSCLGSHRHEAGGFYLPTGCGQNTQPGRRVAMRFDYFKRDHYGRDGDNSFSRIAF